MAGLIKTSMEKNTNLAKPTASYTATQAKSAKMEADERQVDSKSTVAGQMDELLDKNSDYMKRAETKGLQIANSRGLLNTDFAVSAAHGAALDAALPIAQQDAQTYNNQSLTNQGYSNQANQVNTQNEQQVNLANQQADNRASEFNATLSFDQWNAERQREQQEFLTRLDQSGAMERMSAEASANLKGEFVRSWDKARQDAAIAIEKIQMNPDISAADKKTMIEQQIRMRDADWALQKAAFQQLPQWSQNWANYARV